MSKIFWKVLSVLFLIIYSESNLFAQFGSPVTWKTTLQPKGNNTFELKFSASLSPKIHIYSHDIPADAGPVPTSFTFEKNSAVELKGGIRAEGKKITEYDPSFDAELSWFENKVTFIQEVVLKGPKATLKGSYEYMYCDEKQCFPPESEPFSFDLIASADTTKAIEVETVASIDSSILLQGKANDSIAFSWEQMNTDCATGETKNVDSGIWIIFLLGFGGGLLALLTPCVFPMIPLTVSFFTKGGKDKKKGIQQASLYGLSIILIYVTLGLLTTLLFGADALNALSTSAFFNLLFFAIFVVFAISFFGAFEITLPHSWANTTDKLSSKGGFAGIFFMAFTLALVSFSCTGPIIGSLLVEAATGEGPAIGFLKVKPIMGMFGFSLALALPFTLFALFPQWLHSLPKSGGWMSAVKVNLGFLELAFAFKFLSTADLTYNWGFLRWELFIGIWVIIFLLMGIYSLGIGRKGYQSKFLSVFGIAAILFSGYLAWAGISYTPIKLLSGIAPPTYYNYFAPEIKEPSDFRDFDEALAYAKEKNLPLLIDFTGDGCVNCRKMEENVWTKSDVKALMKKYVVVSLYVDDREALPVSQQYYSSVTGKLKQINTIGRKWSDFEIRHFKKASQPYYVAIHPNLEVLTEPVAYTDAIAFKKFLDCGLKQHDKLKN